MTVTATTTVGADVDVVTSTTNVSHSFTRRFLEELRNKFITPFPNLGTELEWSGLINPMCLDPVHVIGEWLTGDRLLFFETWQPTTDESTPEREEEIELHTEYKRGECILLAPSCCPCGLWLFHRPLNFEDATETTTTHNGTLLSTTYSDFLLTLPELFSYHCKGELPIWAGPVIVAEYPDPDEPVTLTVDIETQGGEGVDAEITITPDQDGIVEVAKDFTWLSPQGVTYLFTLSIGGRPYSGGREFPGSHWEFQEFTYPEASYPNVNCHIVKVGDETAAEYQLRTAVNPHRDFWITYETKSDGNSGVARVGFIGQFAETEVNPFVPSAPYHQGEIYERARVLPTEPLPTDKIKDANLPDSLDGDPHLREVERCMADNGESWSQTISQSATTNDGDTVTVTEITITYSW